MSQTNAYLETEVRTATPQKLQLMLLNGAIRFGALALKMWNTGESDRAFEYIVRCRSIVAHILAGIRPDGSDLLKTVAGVYLFVFRQLNEAQSQRQPRRLAEAIRVLQEERTTWQELCEKMPEAPIRERAEEITSGPAEPTTEGRKSYSFEA